MQDGGKEKIKNIFQKSLDKRRKVWYNRQKYIREIYTICLNKGGNFYEKLENRYLIPAIAVSDTGLVVRQN